MVVCNTGKGNKVVVLDKDYDREAHRHISSNYYETISRLAHENTTLPRDNDDVLFQTKKKHQTIKVESINLTRILRDFYEYIERSDKVNFDAFEYEHASILGAKTVIRIRRYHRKPRYNNPYNHDSDYIRQ
ncbi:hypothetical protein GJ496_009608 [Pomphorhynchus laevis]|nr:hypothetical protein GJ496_009608 [Pomphorhynchus laevis]